MKEHSSGFLEQYARAVAESLARMEATSLDGKSVAFTALLDQATQMVHALKERGNTLFFCGNGASAAMAGHMALDWMKAAGVKAASFNDSAMLTAVANDTGYENSFALPISRLGSPGDLLVTISSSGNSPNVLSVIPAARRRNMTVVTFSGLRPDNRSRPLGDLNVYVPCRTYGIAECCHQILLHAWLDHFLGLAEWQLPES